MMFKRKMSGYLMLVESGNPNRMLDNLVSRAQNKGIPVENTAVYTAMCGIRFRSPSDDNFALNYALQIAGGVPFRLFTGYAVHMREIQQ
jgi:hypothetical protein